MKKPYDLTGNRYGTLVCIELGPRTKSGDTTWVLQCDCGNIVIRQPGNFKLSGDRASCGCANKNNYKHGHATGKITSTYGIWCAMKRRCDNPNCADWPDYGMRGITVCKRWSDSFVAFPEDMGERPDGLSIDRIDLNGNYEPSNCRWATSLEQAANKRKST